MTGVVEGLRSFSVDEYHRMGKAGVFAPGERVELIRGVIREMSPKGKRHVQAVTLASHWLIPRLVGRAIVQVQDPVTLGALGSEPEPDLSVLSSADPRDAGSESSKPLLIIEVADSSLRLDRDEKARLYAQASVDDYWVVNLVEDVVEVFRDPVAGEYRTHLIPKRTDTLSPLSFPDLAIAACDLIP